MAEVFKWLSGNTIATDILIIAFVSLAVVITVVAILRKEPISIWGFKFGPESGSRWMVQTGETNIPANDPKKREFFEETYEGRRTILVPVTFDTHFKKHPRIVVSLQKIDLGDFKRSRIDRLLVRAENIRLNGFDLCFETWGDSMVWDAAASWIAVGE